MSIPVWLYNRSNHYSVMAGKCGMEKFVYSIIKPYWIANHMDLQNLGSKIHNFSLELKQSKTLLWHRVGLYELS